MKKIKNTYSPEMKAKIVLDGLCYPDGVAAYCRKMGIKDTLFYKWKSQIVTNAKDIFKPKKKETSEELKHKDEIIRKDKIISELVSENIDLKKRNGVLM